VVEPEIELVVGVDVAVEIVVAIGVDVIVVVEVVGVVVVQAPKYSVFESKYKTLLNVPLSCN